MHHGFGMILFKSFQPGAIPIVLTALLAGYAIADLVSGIVHSLADHLGTKDTPIVGALFHSTVSGTSRFA